MAEQKKMCRMPLRATYRIIDDKPVMVDAEWHDVDPDLIAKFLLDKFGADAIFGTEEDDSING